MLEGKVTGQPSVEAKDWTYSVIQLKNRKYVALKKRRAEDKKEMQE